MRMLTVWAVAASCGLSCTDDVDAPSASAIEDSGAESTNVCCTLGAPSCHCPVVGTRPNGSCETLCDAAPVGWVVETDERGCPRYRIGSASCLSTWRDSGTPLGDAALAREPAATPKFDPPPGKFVGAIEVRITTTSIEQFVYYTTDGTTPNRTSPKVTTPLKLTASTVLRAVAISDNVDRWLPSEVVTGSFVIIPPDAAASD